MRRPIISYSDRLEDVLLYRALGEILGGFYIDVGANHPEMLSVTKLFYELGWSGINIEPSRFWFDALLRQRPRDINLCIAAGSANGTAEFHDMIGTGLSTMVAEYARRHESAGFERRTYSVPVRRLEDICDEHVR
ncbi:MAG TPA: FkbM family methyltransferase, partial [Terriglobales bacterium]|nr:FkbM family methyltransferase [Terriglobales bacterium]